MADTITVKGSISYNPASTSNVPAIRTGTQSVAVTLTNIGYAVSITNIGTSEEEIVLDGTTGLTTPGYILFKNLDGTNFVEVGITTGVYTIKVLAGEFALFRLNGTDGSLFCKADTAACDVQVFAMET